jgi:DNA-binding transcriptional regulator YdaS (Cro superfamily)
MDLKTYLNQERGRGAALAKAIGAHQPDISRWADGTRPIPVHFGVPIEKATEGAVTRKDLFPADWSTIWPELAHGNRRATDPKAATLDPAPGSLSS